MLVFGFASDVAIIGGAIAVAIAGVAGPCIDMAKLFQTQVEFYEKIEGSHLSLEGKASYLSNMLKSNLPLALQGLIVIPIFAGYDLKGNISIT